MGQKFKGRRKISKYFYFISSKGKRHKKPAKCKCEEFSTIIYKNRIKTRIEFNLFLSINLGNRKYIIFENCNIYRSWFMIYSLVTDEQTDAW